MRASLIERAARAVGAVIAAARWLVLPVSLLLFLQWPLRDLLHAWSREANDLAQWLFALYVSVALTDATRERAHLAAGALPPRCAPAPRHRIPRPGPGLGPPPGAPLALVRGAAA